MLKYKKICSIFGHKDNNISENLKNEVLMIFEKLIKFENYNIFFFGELGNFEKFCLEIANNFKNEYPYIKLVYVIPTYSNLNKSTIEFYKKDFDECIYISPRSAVAKQTKIFRDFAMVENSDFCIFNVPKNTTSKPLSLIYANKINKDFLIFE